VPDTGTASGLTSDEVRARQQQYGFNVMPETQARPWRRALEKLWAPIPWMLEAALLLQFVLHEYLEAAIIALLAGFGILMHALPLGAIAALIAACAIFCPGSRCSEEPAVVTFENSMRAT
jgi:H+-transporting ATPase